jgi:hypothetical protein
VQILNFGFWILDLPYVAQSQELEDFGFGLPKKSRLIQNQQPEIQNSKLVWIEEHLAYRRQDTFGRICFGSTRCWYLMAKLSRESSKESER